MANVIIKPEHKADAPSVLMDAFNAVSQRDSMGVRTELHEQDGNLIQKTSIAIPDAELKRNRELRSKRSWRKEETLTVARVPFNLAMELAQKHNINFEDLSVKELLAFLKSEGLTDFITYGGSL